MYKTFHIEPKSMKFEGMVIIISLDLTEEISFFRTQEGMYMVLAVLQSTRKDYRQDSEDYLNSGNYIVNCINLL